MLPDPITCDICQTPIFDRSCIRFLDAHPQHISCLADVVFRNGNMFCQHFSGGGLCAKPLPIVALVLEIMDELPRFILMEERQHILQQTFWHDVRVHELELKI